MLELLYATGMRISELTGLSLSDLALEEQLVRVFGKGSKERLVPVGRYARLAIEAWLGAGGRPALVPRRWARRDDADALFLNLRGRADQPPRGVGDRPPLRGEASAWGAVSPPTCCATAAPPTCWTTGPTSGSSRSSWATPR